MIAVLLLARFCVMCSLSSFSKVASLLCKLQILSQIQWLQQSTEMAVTLKSGTDDVETKNVLQRWIDKSSTATKVKEEAHDEENEGKERKGKSNKKK